MTQQEIYPPEYYHPMAMLDASDYVERLHEPHHEYNGRQRKTDRLKNTAANVAGYYMFRVDLDMDVVDIIVYLEDQLISANTI